MYAIKITGFRHAKYIVYRPNVKVTDRPNLWLNLDRSNVIRQTKCIAIRSNAQRSSYTCSSHINPYHLLYNITVNYKK